MVVTLQGITIRWTKLSRGAPHSAKRAAVPIGFPLQPATLPKKAIRTAVIHWVCAYEHSGFVPAHGGEVHDLTASTHYETEMAILRFEGNDLRAEYRSGFWCHGAPARPNVIRSVFTLQPGQWGRIIANGRFSHNHEWEYYRKIMNVSFSEAPPPASIFTGKPPAEFRDEHDLW